jgi:hypothetical protein
MVRVEGGSMGCHALPVTDDEPMPAFAPPTAPALPPPAPESLCPAYVVPVAGYAAPAPMATHDRFTAVNLVVPQQQELAGRSVIWGALAIIFSVIWIPAILAIVYGAMGVARANRMERAGLEPDGRRHSIAGIIMGGIAVLLSFVWVALLAMAGR